LAGRARADKLGDLAHTLRHSKKAKARISAAVALGRLHDKRGVKALVYALKKDKSKLVRAVSAAALGHIGDARALPALRKAAKDDTQTVSKRASEALIRIERASNDRKVASGSLSAKSRDKRSKYIRMAARERPAYADPKLFVQLKSVADKSKRKTSKRHRKWAAKLMRGYMTSELKRASDVTTDSERADDLGIRRFTVDVTITDFNRRVRGPYVEISCNVRLAVSNQRGRMLSFLTGGAAVQVPKRTFKKKYENQLRKEALQNAAKSVHQDLMTYLEKEMRL
jgi:hypothetical protein